jgi:hypothetical protein
MVNFKIAFSLLQNQIKFMIEQAWRIFSIIEIVGQDPTIDM